MVSKYISGYMKKTLRIKHGAIHMTVRRDSVTKLVYLFRNLSAIRKIRLLLPILSNIYSNPVSSFLSISAKAKSANESGTTGGKFCFIYLRSVSYLTVFLFSKLPIKEKVPIIRFFFIYLLKSIMFCLERLFVKL